jgi:predicted RNA methylase
MSDGLELVRAYHRGEGEVADAQLDAALGLPAQCFELLPDRDRALAQRHPGESTVDVATPFDVCRGLFAQLSLGADDVFFDLGCAAGRVVLYGAAVTPARFVGIELVQERAELARGAADRFGQARVRIVTGNVLEQDLSEATVIYAFRPFSVETEASVLERVHHLAAQRPITVAAHRLQPSLFDAAVFDRAGDGALVILRSRVHR